MESSSFYGTDQSLVSYLASIQLMPYIYDVTRKAALQNDSCLYSMSDLFPKDGQCLHLDGQYMIGKYLLVIPVHQAGSLMEFYLPHGIWTNYLTGGQLEGNQWCTEVSSSLHPLLYIRENAVLPTAMNDESGYSKIQFRIYTLQNKIRIADSFYDQYTSQTWNYMVRQIRQQLTVSSDSVIPYAFRIMNQSIQEADHAFLLEEGADTLVQPDCNASIFTLKLHT